MRSARARWRRSYWRGEPEATRTATPHLSPWGGLASPKRSLILSSGCSPTRPSTSPGTRFRSMGAYARSELRQDSRLPPAPTRNAAASNQEARSLGAGLAGRGRGPFVVEALCVCQGDSPVHDGVATQPLAGHRSASSVRHVAKYTLYRTAYTSYIIEIAWRWRRGTQRESATASRQRRFQTTTLLRLARKRSTLRLSSTNTLPTT